MTATENLITLLKKHWGYDTFRGSQQDIITAALHKQDVLALLPTGGGKSLCYQLPAVAQEGIAIVVSPLIALIQDQVGSLKAKGVKALGLTGKMSQNEVIQCLDNAAYGGYKLLYLSPERLQQEIVLDRLAELNVSLVAIDEAHCISQWGHDFRPAYLQCIKIRDIHPEVPIMALTATATKRVISEIQSRLDLRIEQVYKDSFHRPNLAYRVLYTENKKRALYDAINDHKGSKIVYVRLRRSTEKLRDGLRQNGTTALAYHGGLSTLERKEALSSWMKGETTIMVATTAFGMGIDKSDVRAVIHYEIPESIESYFQEGGRAGRDGLPAKAILIVGPNDESQSRRQFLSYLPDLDILKKVYHHLVNHFQIAYAEGKGITYPFHFGTFCAAYDLEPRMCFKALEIFDQQGILALSQNFRHRSMLQFTASKKQLWSYLDSHPENRDILELIVRSYGGVFDAMTFINLASLTKKGAGSETTIRNVLSQLVTDQIAKVEFQDHDVEVTFLEPREDEKSILRKRETIEKNRRVKIENLEHMLKYIDCQEQCRSIQLLAYFGEEFDRRCGICDVCLSDRPQIKKEKFSVKRDIQAALIDSSFSSDQLAKKIQADKDLIIECLQELLEDELIRVTLNNQYELI
ncbi:MAG: RecQ family ATP-dependent DNA helicase [Bacteroidia bacterium]|nr:RecQ family ATP-dependent DNA helicase [Bacteroidia bacterium]